MKMANSKNKKNNNKNYNMLDVFNNKRVIILASFQGVDQSVIDTVEVGFKYLIADCNVMQHEFVFEYFNLADEEIQTFGAMIPEDCPYDDETVKTFLITQMAVAMGSMLEEQESVQIYANQNI